MWRNIIELCPVMNNNDEIVFYTEDELKPNDPRVKKYSRYSDGNQKLVLSRKLYEGEEMETGFVGERHDEKVAEETRFLDAYFILRRVFREMERVGLTPTDSVSMYVASNFYDCMSGGMMTAEISILRFLCKDYNISLNQEVYPSGERKPWHTLKDWLKETEGVVDFRDFSKVKRLQPIFGVQGITDGKTN